MAHLLTGLVAAVHTPFHSDGSLNLDLVESYAELLARNGVRGVFVCGSTGEGVSMTVDERISYAQRWCEVARHNLKVVAHVGHTSIGDACVLAEQAARAGAHAIATIAPSVLRPQTLEDLVDWCAAVAARAPNTPYYYYHIPVLTHVLFDMTRYLELARKKIPTLAGIKFTSENLMEFADCAALDGGLFNMLFGRDEILLSGLVAGAHGAIGSTYNYAAPVYMRMIAAYERGDLPTAQREMARARGLVRILLEFGGSASKAMLKFCGVDCGPVRLPLRTLTPDQEAELYRRLEEHGWDDVRCR